MLDWRKVAVGAAVCSLMALVAACGGGGSGGGSGGSSGGGGSSSSSSTSSSSSSSSVTSYVAGSEIVVARAFDYETIAVTGLSNGNYVVVWNGYDIEGDAKDTDRSGIYFRIFNPSGSAVTPVRVANTLTANDQTMPSVSALSGGGFVIAWNHGRAVGDPAFSDTIHAQRFDNGGNKQGSQSQISTHLEGSSAAKVMGLSGGGYVVTWNDFIPAGGSGGVARNRIKIRVYSASGSAVTSEALLDEISSESLTVARGTLTPRADGGFVYLKSSHVTRPASTGTPHLSAQVYSASATAIGTGYYVNDAADGAFLHTAVPLSGGGYVASWMRTSDNQITYRRVDASDMLVGTQAGFAFDTPGLYVGKLAPLKSGGFVSASNTTNMVHAQVFNADLTPFGSVYTAISDGIGPRGVSAGAATGGSFAVSWFLDFESPKTLKLRIYSPT